MRLLLEFSLFKVTCAQKTRNKIYHSFANWYDFARFFWFDVNERKTKKTAHLRVFAFAYWRDIS